MMSDQSHHHPVLQFPHINVLFKMLTYWNTTHDCFPFVPPTSPPLHPYRNSLTWHKLNQWRTLTHAHHFVAMILNCKILCNTWSWPPFTSTLQILKWCLNLHTEVRITEILSSNIVVKLFMAFLFVCVGAHLSRRWRILTKSCSSSSAALRCNLSRRWWKSAVERSFCTSTWRTLPVFFWKMEARRRLKVGSFSRAAHRRACSSSSAWEDPIADSRGLPPPKMLKFAVPVDRLKLEDRKSALMLLDNDRELRRLWLERIACNLSLCSSPTSGSRSFSSFPPFVNSISLTSSSTNFTSCWSLSF